MSQLDTSIDRLVEFIRLKKSTSVEEAARALSLSAKQVEEIAEILAESGLIHLKYEFSGIRLTPQLVNKEESKAPQERKKTVLERLIEIHDEVRSVAGMVVFSQKDVERRLDIIREHFREIEELDLRGDDLDELKRRVEELLNDLEQIQMQLADEQKKTAGVREEMKKFEGEVVKHRGKKGFGNRFLQNVSRLFRLKP